jgi:hypothetical protein
MMKKQKMHKIHVPGGFFLPPGLIISMTIIIIVLLHLPKVGITK